MAGSVTKRVMKSQQGSTVRWRARYPRPNGLRNTDQIEKLFDRKDDAWKWIHEQQHAVASGGHIAPREGERRFADVYEAWRVTRWPGLQPKTTSRYGQVWRTYLEPEFGSRKLNTISRELVRRYFARLTQQGSAAGTVRKVHAVMSAIMSEGVELGYLKVNPCAGVKGLPRPAHREMLFLTADEVRALAEEITPHYRCRGMKLSSGPAVSIVLPGDGALLGGADGQADITDELRARRCSWPPLRLARLC